MVRGERLDTGVCRMEIRWPTQKECGELYEKISRSKAVSILSLIWLLQIIGHAVLSLLGWKAQVEEAVMTTQQFAPFLGHTFSVLASPWLGFVLVLLGLGYLVFVPTEDHPSSHLMTMIIAWIACGLSLLALFVFSVFVVATRIARIQPLLPGPGAPDVSLGLVYPEHPALLLMNPSNMVAKEIKYGFVVWNLDLPNQHNPLPIPWASFDFIRPHEVGGPQDLFNPVMAQLTKGNRLFGYADVSCPDCANRRLFWVYIIWGQGGWFAPVQPGSPYLQWPTLFSSIPLIVKNIDLLNQIARPDSRITIKGWP